MMLTQYRHQIIALLCTYVISLSAHAASYADSVTQKLLALNGQKAEIYGSLLYLQPYSDSLEYAVYVSGIQPNYQSWYYQTIRPSFSPGFEVGIRDAFLTTKPNKNLAWLHLESSDSASKQTSRNTALATVEFVAPPYEVGPQVFGIKRASSTIKFDYDSVLLNVGQWFSVLPSIDLNVFGGLNVLRIVQNQTTIFSDYAGATATPYSYALPADPSYSMRILGVSDYVGVGLDLGLTAKYQGKNNIGLLSSLLGTLTVGTMNTQLKVFGTSRRTIHAGLGTKYQTINAPAATKLVPGIDGKLGVFYDYHGDTLPEFNLEIGYRGLMYLYAIATPLPTSLVQPGTIVATPEFATGTMAISSTASSSSAFSLNGPYLTLTARMH